MEPRREPESNTNLASVIGGNPSAVLGAAIVIVKDLSSSFSKSEITIIDAAQRFYKVIFGTEEYPNHFKYSTSNSFLGRKFPAYELPNGNIIFAIDKLGNNRLASHFQDIIEELIECYNRYQDTRWWWPTPTNAKAITRILLYLIDIAYSLSEQDLSKLTMLDQIEAHINYVENILTLEELKLSAGYFNRNINVSKILTDMYDILTKQCRPEIKAIHDSLSAQNFLKEIGNSISSLCNNGFRIAVNIVSPVILPTVSLVKIEKEKYREEGNPAVRKFAYDLTDQNNNQDLTFHQFIYNLSTSLISVFGIIKKNEQIQEYRPYITKEIEETLSRYAIDFYEPLFNGDFFKSYLIFCSSLEKFSQLFQLIKEASKTFTGGGNLFYFVVAGDASALLLEQIKTVQSTLSEAYKKMLELALNHYNKLTFKDSKDKSRNDANWVISYGESFQANYTKIFKVQLINIETICIKLENLHNKFSSNRKSYLEDMIAQCKHFCDEVHKFHGNVFPGSRVSGLRNRDALRADISNQSIPAAIPENDGSWNALVRQLPNINCQSQVASLLKENIRIYCTSNDKLFSNPIRNYFILAFTNNEIKKKRMHIVGKLINTLERYNTPQQEDDLIRFVRDILQKEQWKRKKSSQLYTLLVNVDEFYKEIEPTSALLKKTIIELTQKNTRLTQEKDEEKRKNEELSRKSEELSRERDEEKRKSEELFREKEEEKRKSEELFREKEEEKRKNEELSRKYEKVIHEKEEFEKTSQNTIKELRESTLTLKMLLENEKTERNENRFQAQKPNQSILIRTFGLFYRRPQQAESHPLHLPAPLP